MFAILGDIEIEVAGGLIGMEWRETSDWAEHARIAGKPLLEWVGDGLTEYTLDILLHPMLGDPEARLQEMKAAKAQHLPLKLVFGNGDYPGAYAITDIGATPKRAMADGRIFTASLRVTLREFVGEISDQSRPRGLLSRSLAAEPAAPDVQTQAAQPVSLARKLLGHARSAATLLRSGMELYSAAQVLRSNPAALLSRVPRLLDATRDVMAPLGEYLGVAELMDGGGELVSAASGAMSDVLSARSWLTAMDAGNAADRLEAAGGALERAAGRLSDVDIPLARMAADVVTRRA